MIEICLPPISSAQHLSKSIPTVYIGTRMCFDGEKSAQNTACAYDDDFVWTQTPCTDGDITGLLL